MGEVEVEASCSEVEEQRLLPQLSDDQPGPVLRGGGPDVRHSTRRWTSAGERGLTVSSSQQSLFDLCFMLCNSIVKHQSRRKLRS